MTSTFAIPGCFVHSRHFYFVLIGMDGYYVTANSKFLEKFGFDPTGLTSITALDTVHPEDQQLCFDTMQWCIQHPDRPQNVQLRKPDADGRYIHTRWEITYLQPGIDAAEGMVQCIGVDITNETEQAVAVSVSQQQTKDREQFFEKVLRNSIDVIMLVDPAGNILYTSPNVEQEMGYTPQELVGKNGFSFVHADDMPRAIEAFEQQLYQPEMSDSVDLRFQRKDGSWCYAEAKGRNMLHEPEVNAIIITLNDIELRKKAEQALSESENRYRSFFHNLPLPLFLVRTTDYSIIQVNLAAQQKYGYDTAEMTSISLHQLFANAIEPAEIKRVCEQGTKVQHRKRNGDIIYVRLEQNSVAEVDQELQLLLVHDVTEMHSRESENIVTHELSDILMQSGTMVENLQLALKKIRSFVNWELVELWVPVYDHSSIRNDISDFDLYHPAAPALRSFVSATRASQYAKEVYSTSPAYKLKHPFWIEDLQHDERLVRRELALAHGFRSVLAIPVVQNGLIICWLFFFSFESKARDIHTEKLVSTLGTLIGNEIEKRKKNLVLDRFFQISPDIMTIAGLDGRFLKTNPAFAKFIGFSPEEAKSLHPLHYVHPDDRGRVLEKLQGLSYGIPVPYFENRVVTKDGVVKWIAWTATPVLEEGMVIATHRDVTEQKMFEENLKVSNERYELATRATSNMAIWDLNLIANVMTWSEGYQKLFGYGTHDNETGLEFWEKNIHPEDRDSIAASFNHFINQSQTPNWQVEYRFMRRDGTYAYIVDRAYMIFDQQQRPIRVVGAMEDVTERKILEQELILKERMRQKQIAQAAIDAQEKERAEIGKDLHDNISQMLTSTKLFLDILCSKQQDELLTRSLKNINIIIQEIRGLSRSLVPSSIEDLGLIASINDLIESVRLTNVTEVEFYPDAEVEELIPPNAKLTLYRIIQEQINNIMKHAEARNVLIELFSDQNHIELIVTDNGKGFDINKIKKGLGLKNMKSRAELLNGTAEILTNENKGCKLKVRIPIITLNQN